MADMTTHLMLDDVDLAVEAGRITTNTYAIAGYVNGARANWPAIVAKYGRSGMYLLSIDVQAYPPAGAQCLDIESGDATIGQAAKWFKETQAAGKAARDLRWYPKLYVSAGNAASLIATMATAGIGREEYMLWTAHYGWPGGAHICGPDTCKYPQADATQYTSSYDGVSLDASLCYGYFFSGPPSIAPVTPAAPPAPPKPAVLTADAWAASATLQNGNTGDAVKVLQILLRNSGIEGVRGITVDGLYGPQTLTAVRNFQAAKSLSVDGIAGPKTHAALTALDDFNGPVVPKVEVPVPAVTVSPVSPVKPAVVPVPTPAPSVPLLYVQKVLDAPLAKALGLTEGTILFIPQKVA